MRDIDEGRKKSIPTVAWNPKWGWWRASMLLGLRDFLVFACIRQWVGHLNAHPEFEERNDLLGKACKQGSYQ